MLLEPLHACIGISVPFGGPCRDALFVLHISVKLLTKKVAPLAYNQAAIVRTSIVEIDQALEAAESRLCRVLILVWPRFVFREMCAVGKAEVDGIKRDYEFFVLVNLFERFNDAWFAADIPDKVLMTGSISE